MAEMPQVYATPFVMDGRCWYLRAGRDSSGRRDGREAGGLPILHLCCDARLLRPRVLP